MKKMNEGDIGKWFSGFAVLQEKKNEREERGLEKQM